MATDASTSAAILFPHRQRTRLRVSLNTSKVGGVPHLTHNSLRVKDNDSLDGFLRAAQQEVVEQEIFSVLVKEASSLPTASARVSERFIVIDVAQGMELRFELVSLDIRNTLRNSSRLFALSGGY
jgi:mediator of RNA polymerase II transcription subunit 17, fungi type